MKFYIALKPKKAIPIVMLSVGLIAASHTALADVQVIKLLCNLDVTVHHLFPKVTERSNETVGVDMHSDAVAGLRAIFIHSLTVPILVANSKDDKITSYQDNSDDNRWEIWNDRGLEGGISSHQMVAVDRQTGQLTALLVMTSDGGKYRETTEATGFCRKVDTDKLQF